MAPQAPGDSPWGPPEDLPHDTLQSNLIGASVAIWGLTAVFVALRFYTRSRIISTLNSSDWLILAALLFSLGLSVGESEGAVHGAGVHAWDLDPSNTAGYLNWGLAMWYSLLFYTLSLCCSKMSILMLYINIFSLLRIRQAAQVVMGIVIITSVYLVCTVFTACIPLQAYWNIAIPPKHCHPQSLWWGNAILLVVTDFLVFLVPLPTIWLLRLRKKQKYMLFGIYCLGLFVCIIAIVRLVYLVYLDTHPQPDFFYSSTPFTYWTLVEVNGAILCACVMTLKPLAAQVFPRVFGSNLSDREPDSDQWNPPTIGSIPWRHHPRGSRLGEGRNDRDLEEVPEEGTGQFGTGVKMQETGLTLEHRSIDSVSGGTSGSAAADDLEKWRHGFPVPEWANGQGSQTDILHK